ncbi:MAG: protein kinase [Elusimicrobia bacterium]|nr:protein kinase [Elusimicrobiota bacterium]
MRFALILTAALGFSPRRAAAAGVAVSSTAALSQPRALVERAASELKAKDYAAAEKDATKAMDLGYRKSSAFNTRSAARTGLGRFKEAFADADMAVKFSSLSATGYLNRAAAREGLGAPAADILADFKQASEFDRRWESVYEDAQKRYAVPEKKVPPKVNPEPPRAREPAVPALPTAKPVPPAPVPWLRIAASAVVVVVLGVLVAKGLGKHRARRVRFGSVMSVPLPPGDEPRMGAVVGGRYIVGKLLGKEGSAQIYDARDLDDQPCRILRLARREGVSVKGVGAAMTLKHPGILAPAAVFEYLDHVCLAGPVFRGEPLRQSIDRLVEHRLPPEAALRIVQAVCDALDFAHQRGIFHGHLTSSHILVDKASIQVMGFLLPPEPSESDYIAPERDSGGSSVEADIFSAGVCLYEMLTGQRPFKGPEAGQDKREGRFAAASSVAKLLPEGVDDLLGRALQSDPARRFHAAGELFGAFRNLVIPGVH